jgi:dTMP kinase
VLLGLERVSSRGKADRIEQESVAFFDRVRQTYLRRAASAPERFVVIDASVDEQAVWQQLERILQQRVSQ